MWNICHYFVIVVLNKVIMSPKRTQTSLELRKLIIQLRSEGKTIKEISEVVHRSSSTVHDIITKYNKENRVCNISRKGQGKKLSEGDDKFIKSCATKNPFLSANNIKIMVEEERGKTVSAETIRRSLRSFDLHGRTAVKKPFISEKNKKQRLQFARMHINKPNTFWNKVLFTDESKFNLHGSDGRRFVWRRPNESFHPKNIRATIKHGGGSLMVWGCFSASGTGNLHFIEGIMDRFKYVDILKNELKPSCQKLGIEEDFIFYQDNDPKHKSEIARTWLIYNCPHVLDTPPQSPDLNAIEHIWNELGRRVYQKSNSNLDELKANILEAWNSIPPEFCQKLVDSMQRRLEAVIASKGYATKY